MSATTLNTETFKYSPEAVRNQALKAVRWWEEELIKKPCSTLFQKPVIKLCPKAQTEPCQSGESHLHRLACGHLVYTHDLTVCGRNCNNPIESFAPFLCLLCARWEMVCSGKVSRRTSKYSNLLLPDFPDVDQSNIAAIDRARACEVTFAAKSGSKVFIPRSREDIAIVRVEEKKHVRFLLHEVIPRAVGDMAKKFNSGVAHAAQDYLVKCINNQHRFVQANMEELTVAVLYVASKRAGKDIKNKLPALCSSLGVDELNVDILLPIITDLLNDFDARVAIRKFFNAPGKTHAKLNKDKDMLISLTMKLWYRVRRENAVSPPTRREQWDRVITSCIRAVLKTNNVSLSTREISHQAGLKPALSLWEPMDLKTEVLAMEYNEYNIDFVKHKLRRGRKNALRARRGAHLRKDALLVATLGHVDAATKLQPLSAETDKEKVKRSLAMEEGEQLRKRPRIAV